MFDLSGRPIVPPPAVASPPLAPGQVNPGFGVIGTPGQDAFGQDAFRQAPNKGTAADVFAAYTMPPPPRGAQGEHRFVGPIRAIGLGFRKYVRFSGRSSRSEFWWWILFWYLVLIGLSVGLGFLIVALANGACATESLTDCNFNPTPLWIYGAVFLVFFLGTFAPTVAVMCRRLQDTDRSGSWVWLYFGTILINFFPVVGRYISLAIQILFIVWLALPASPGPNRFGDVPAEGR
jgi:uncharacterized membrane protein YhaH (DUF805 family)